MGIPNTHPPLFFLQSKRKRKRNQTEKEKRRGFVSLLLFLMWFFLGGCGGVAEEGLCVGFPSLALRQDFLVVSLGHFPRPIGSWKISNKFYSQCQSTFNLSMIQRAKNCTVSTMETIDKKEVP